MSRLQAWFERRWYGGVEPGLLLRGLSRLFAGIVALRRLGYHRRWFKAHRVEAPVVVIGNLTVGGTGKTPLVIAVVEWLKARGWNPGVVSRGHGRSSRGLVRVGPDTSSAAGGDEPCLIHARTGAVVVVDADRVAAAEAALAAGADIIVCDDGLQHYRLARDLEIELVDARRGHGNGRLLPAGPMREPLARAAQCDVHVVNGGSVDEEGKWAMRLEPLGVVPLAEWQAAAAAGPLSALAGRRVHAVAGVGHPARFFDSLRAAGLDVVGHPFPDHHAFAPGDLVFDEALPVLVTEKDAVKLAGLALEGVDVRVVPARAVLDSGFYAVLAGQLTRFQAGMAGIDIF